MPAHPKRLGCLQSVGTRWWSSRLHCHRTGPAVWGKATGPRHGHRQLSCLLTLAAGPAAGASHCRPAAGPRPVIPHHPATSRVAPPPWGRGRGSSPAPGRGHQHQHQQSRGATPTPPLPPLACRALAGACLLSPPGSPGISGRKIQQRPGTPPTPIHENFLSQEGRSFFWPAGPLPMGGFCRNFFSITPISIQDPFSGFIWRYSPAFWATGP